MKLVKTHGSLNEICARDAAPDEWASSAKISFSDPWVFTSFIALSLPLLLRRA